MITYSWLEPKIFALHLRHYIRRYTRATAKPEAIRLFADDKGLSEDHLTRVWDMLDEPSNEVLQAVNAEPRIIQNKMYRFRR